MQKEFKIINSLAQSAAVAIIFIAVITIMADLQPGLKDWLKDVFWHHWIGKGILAASIFVFLSFLLLILPISVKENRTAKNLWLLFWITTAATISIFAFYIYEASFAIYQLF